jgi:sugar phosphate isomerase/epimerase
MIEGKMHKLPPLSRRKFVKYVTATALGAVPFANLATSFSNNNPLPNKELKIFIFSKHLQFLDYRSMCEASKEMGFDGVDLTLRVKGHVLPEHVVDDLPKATEAMNSFGLQPQLLTTNVSDANNPVDRKVLETVSQLGYSYYRTGWFKYDKEKDIQKSLQIFQEKIQALAQLNKSLGITGSYQNHSGNYMGASIWDLDQILEGISTKDMGCQFDIMHATVEGGKNWEIDFRLIKNHINTLVIKDFRWGKVGSKWKPVNTPLGEGMVNFKKYFSILKKYKIDVPISLHCEYDLGGAERGGTPSISHKEIFKKLKNDLSFIRNLWKEVG